MTTRDFRADVKRGNYWEDKLKDKLANIMFHESIRMMKYGSENLAETQLQREGIDGEIILKTIKFDIKTRANYTHKWKDILIETVSVVEKDKPGWFYYSKADFIAYTWENENDTNLIDGYLLFLQNKKLKSWFEENKHSFYSPSDAETYDKLTGRRWHTPNKAPKISTFPQDTLIRFNPTISLETQLSILDYLKDEEHTYEEQMELGDF